jgi:hypothetical protein
VTVDSHAAASPAPELGRLLHDAMFSIPQPYPGAVSRTGLVGTAAARESSESGGQGTKRFPDITVGRAPRAHPPDSDSPASIFWPEPVAAQTCWAEAITGSDKADLILRVAGRPGGASVRAELSGADPGGELPPLGGGNHQNGAVAIL